jgi:tetratricopeptide (TPR) repeat protein
VVSGESRLNVLADWGAVGATLLAAALALYLWPLGRNWIKTVLDPTALNAATTNYHALTCGGFASTFALLAHSAADYQWYAPGVMLTFTAIVAMLICQTQSARWNFAARFPVGVVLAALVIFQAFQASKTVREHHWLNKANAAVSYEDRIEQLKRAFAVEPTNFQTAYSIGETYRLASWEGGPAYKELAVSAIEWLDRAAQLNPFDAFPRMRKAMCLDWLKRHAEAEAEIQKALLLDPQSYLVLAIAGWHYYQAGADARARKYLLASYYRNWNWHNNPIAHQYLTIVQHRLREKTK